MAASDRIRLNDAAITETSQSVAASLAQAAQPGPVPVATGASPIDAAAASVAGAVATNVAASSAQLAPRSAEGLAKSQAALAQMKATDNTNAADLKTVPESMHGTEANRGAAGVRAVSAAGDDDWFYGDDNLDRAVDPGGAGPGPSVIPGSGIPPSLI